jgi:hypothetical protein
LPAELRENILIYALVLKEDVKIVEGPVESGKFGKIMRRKAKSFSLQVPFTKTFLLSRQFYHEALPIAYGMNTFHFNDLMIFVHFFLDKFVSARFVKKICLEVDQSSMAKPLGGFLDVVTLLSLNRKYHNFLTEPMNGNHVHFLDFTLRKLPKVPHLNVKFTTIFNGRSENLKYYASIFALLFSQEIREPKENERATLEFTFRSPHFKYSPEHHRRAPAKYLPEEVKSSLNASALAVMYMLPLRHLRHVI